jgi:diaminopimelate epimerase
MKFTKMHGLGNDYVYVNGFDERVEDPAVVARQVADRHRGVGGDGLILILPSEVADVRMRMFNADGSESEMCGNGVRCVAKYAYDHGLTRHNPMRVETGRGVLTLAMKVVEGKVREVTVNMGEPILALPEIPVDAAHVVAQGPHVYRLGLSDGNVAPDADARPADRQHLGQRPTLADATFVSMGNPHAVMYVDRPEELAAFPLARWGPLVEHHKAFPRRVNAHWVHVHSPGEVTMRTWERGSGITQACGTGACAVAVAGVLTGRTARRLLAHLPGGDLTLEWRESDNMVSMTGPATEVFSGEWRPA